MTYSHLDDFCNAVSLCPLLFLCWVRFNVWKKNDKKVTFIKRGKSGINPPCWVDTNFFINLFLLGLYQEFFFEIPRNTEIYGKWTERVEKYETKIQFQREKKQWYRNIKSLETITFDKNIYLLSYTHLYKACTKLPHGERAFVHSHTLLAFRRTCKLRPIFSFSIRLKPVEYALRMQG